MSNTGSEILSILNSALKNHEDIRRLWNTVISWFRTNQLGILIIGPGGVGKTTLAHVLQGKYDSFLDIPGEYDESLGVETEKLKDDDRISIVVPPGQFHRRESTWNELLHDLENGIYQGIILVTSYGYHSIGDFDYTAHRLFEAGDTKGSFLEKYTEDRRSDEISVLKRLKHHIISSYKPLWFLTYVGKQDLWWLSRAKVEEHYGRGEFGAELEEIKNSKNDKHFRYEIVYGSLFIGQFTTGRDDILAENAQGYGTNELAVSLRRLLATISALKDWKIQ